MSHSTSPSLNADDGVALADNFQLHGVGETPLEASVDVFLPDLDVEVGLLLGEVERVNSTVEVGVLKGSLASELHDTMELGVFWVNLREQRFRCE